MHKGGYKLRANAVVFAQPAAQLLTVLPMPKSDLDNIVAVLFTGSVGPTTEDFKRTPLLVRPKFVWQALQWLRQNHSDYKDVQLSHHNLATYAENEMALLYFYQQ